MRIDGTVSSLTDAARRAAELENAGYDAMWAGELNADPFLPLAVAAEATSRLALGTGIAVAFARSPMSLAYTANDLQNHSGGRLLLGLGSQVKPHIERRFSMPWSHPAARMREYVLALRAIWSAWQQDTPLNFTGNFYRHTLMPKDFAPAPHNFGPPKVLLAGVGDRMTELAGEVADGFICHGYTTARWLKERTLPSLHKGRNGPLHNFEVTAAPFIVTGTDEEIAARLPKLRAQLAFYASTPAYRAVLDLHGWGAINEDLTTLSKAGRWTEMATLITDEIIEEFAIISTPTDLPTRVSQRFGGILTRISFTPPPSLTPEEAEELVNQLRTCC